MRPRPPLIWMEVRCDLINTPAVNTYGQSLCHETGPGGFYRSAAEAVKATKKAGWRHIGDAWICPQCKRVVPGDV